MAAKVPAQINFRLSPGLRTKLGARMDETGMTISETVRVLLETALREGERSEAIDSAAIRQGILRGVAHVNGRLAQTFTEMLKEVGPD